MRWRAVILLIFIVILANLGRADDIAGQWQGSLDSGPKQLRAVIEISRSEDGGWKAVLHSVDETTEVLAADSVVLDGSHIRMTVDPIGASLEGTIVNGGSKITAIWKSKETEFLDTRGKPHSLVLQRATKETAWQIDPTPHRRHFIGVAKNVKLEVLDWGGTGRTLVFVPGSGNTAHTFDKIATKLSASYHVYGITRRGFGASSAPEPTAANYLSDRLGDDVIAVMDALKLTKPVLVGHSLGGEELSSVGSRHPEKVAGLIYLEAAYHWAYYDKAHGDLIVDRNEVRRKLEGTSGASAQDTRGPLTIGYALQQGMQKYTSIPVPALAIYAIPHDRGFKDPAARADADAKDMVTSGGPAKAFETGVPSAHVVILSHANHFVFLSNEADVIREMNSFLTTLP